MINTVVCVILYKFDKNSRKLCNKLTCVERELIGRCLHFSQCSKLSTLMAMATFPKESLRPSGAISLTSASLMNWTKTSGFIKTSVQCIWSNYFCSFVKVYTTVKVPSFSFSFSLPGTVKLAVRRWLSTSQRQAPYRTVRWVLFTRLQRQAASSLHFVGTALDWWVHVLFGAQSLYLHLQCDDNPHKRWNKIFSASWETDIQICIYFKKHRCT